MALEQIISISVDCIGGDSIKEFGKEISVLERFAEGIAKASLKRKHIKINAVTDNSTKFNYLLSRYPHGENIEITQIENGSWGRGLKECLNLQLSGKASGSYSIVNTKYANLHLRDILPEISGLERPALLVDKIPTYDSLNSIFNPKKNIILLDAGATPDPDPYRMIQWAKCASAYASAVKGIKSPAIVLSNIGSEANKGSSLYAETYKLLVKEHELKTLNFVGNAEKPLQGRTEEGIPFDIILMDGQAGNNFIKWSADVLKFGASYIKYLSKISQDPIERIADLYSSKKKKESMKKSNFLQFGGALFIGVKGVVCKGHGISNSDTISSGILWTAECAEKKVVERIVETMEKNYSSEAVS